MKRVCQLQVVVDSHRSTDVDIAILGRIIRHRTECKGSASRTGSLRPTGNAPGCFRSPAKLVQHDDRLLPRLDRRRHHVQRANGGQSGDLDGRTVDVVAGRDGEGSQDKEGARETARVSRVLVMGVESVLISGSSILQVAPEGSAAEGPVEKNVSRGA